MNAPEFNSGDRYLHPNGLSCVIARTSNVPYDRLYQIPFSPFVLPRVVRRFTVPNDVDDEDVLMFRVPGTELQINQRSPWKLSPVLEAVPDK